MAKKLFSRNSWSNFFSETFGWPFPSHSMFHGETANCEIFCYLDCLTDHFWRCYVLLAKPTCNALDSRITFPRWQLEAQIFTTKYFDYLMTLSVLPGILLSPFKTPTECAETKIFLKALSNDEIICGSRQALNPRPHSNGDHYNQ